MFRNQCFTFFQSRIFPPTEIFIPFFSFTEQFTSGCLMLISIFQKSVDDLRKRKIKFSIFVRYAAPLQVNNNSSMNYVHILIFKESLLTQKSHLSSHSLEKMCCYKETGMFFILWGQESCCYVSGKITESVSIHATSSSYLLAYLLRVTFIDTNKCLSMVHLLFYVSAVSPFYGKDCSETLAGSNVLLHATNL